MSSASRWATADDQSDTPSNSKQQYDAELEDVLGSRQDEEDEDESFQYTGEDSVRLEEALGEQEPEPEPSVDDESFSYEDQLADVLGQERIPEQTAVFPRAYLNGNEHPKPDISDVS